jgi:hypothetical protein
LGHFGDCPTATRIANGYDVRTECGRFGNRIDKLNVYSSATEAIRLLLVVISDYHSAEGSVLALCFYNCQDITGVAPSAEQNDQRLKRSRFVTSVVARLHRSHNPLASVSFEGLHRFALERRDAFSLDDRCHSASDYAQIEQERLPINVVNIEIEPLVPSHQITTCDLSQTGEPWTNLMAACLMR